jgi:hypothetical protein
LQTGLTISVNGVTVPSVTYINGTTVQFTTPALGAGDYDVKLTNANGLSAILQNGIAYNGTPNFVTPAGKLGNDLAPSSTIPTITIVAAEPDGGALSYSITSGALPTGVFMSSSGVITGSTPETSGTTTYNFTVTATDDENQTNSRAFNLVVLRPVYSAQLTNALKLDAGNIETLNWTPATAGDRTKCTLSLWVKRSSLGDHKIFSSGTTANDSNFMQMYFGSGHELRISLATIDILRTSAVFRDVGTWYHIVLQIDTAQANASDRINLWVNGDKVTSYAYDNRSAIAQSSSLGINHTETHYFGRTSFSTGQIFDGYLAAPTFIDGQAYSPAEFAESYYGAWVPKTYTGTYGTNGFKLAFDEGWQVAEVTANTDNWDSYFVQRYATDTTSIISTNYTSTDTASLALYTSTYGVYCDHDAADTIKVSDFSMTLPHEPNGSATPAYLGLRFTDGSEFFITGSGGNGNMGTGEVHYGYGACRIRWVEGVGVKYSYTYDDAVGNLVASSTDFSGKTLYQARAYRGYSSGGATLKFHELVLNYPKAFEDSSGNNNDVTKGNLSPDNIVVDTPTNNFATLNPLKFQTAGAITEGNLLADSTNNTFSTIIPTPTGKWYFENFVITAPGGAVNHLGVGRHDVRADNTGWDNGNFIFWREDGIRQYNGTTTTGYTTYTAGDVIGVVLDYDNETVSFFKNGAAVTGFTDLAFPSNFYKGSGFEPVSFIVRPNSGCSSISNYGQDSSFGGRKAAQSNTDANDIGSFQYAPPSGALALCSKNLEEPGISTVLGGKPSDHFKPILWTGNGASTQQVEVGFPLGLMIVKDRNVGYHWRTFDKVRGFNNSLFLNRDVTENTHTDYGYPVATDSTTVTIGQGTHSGNLINGSGTTFVGWCFNAGDSIVANNNGTIPTQVAANTEAGFSILTYTGTGAAGSVGHGLTQKPAVYWTKNRSGVGDWLCFAPTISDGRYLVVNSSAMGGTNTGNYPTDTTLYLADAGSYHNTAGNTYVTYCWHPVAGFSDFGTYLGSGSSEGIFVNLDFKPAMIIIKAIDGADNSWWIYDNMRDPYNLTYHTLHPSDSGIEEANASYGLDFVSNGFKLKNGDVRMNGADITYMYMAFAEDPFKYSTAR